MYRAKCMVWEWNRRREPGRHLKGGWWMWSLKLCHPVTHTIRTHRLNSDIYINVCVEYPYFILLFSFIFLFYIFFLLFLYICMYIYFIRTQVTFLNKYERFMCVCVCTGLSKSIWTDRWRYLCYSLCYFSASHSWGFGYIYIFICHAKQRWWWHTIAGEQEC